MNDSHLSKQQLKQVIYEGILKSLEIVASCHSTNITPRFSNSSTSTRDQKKSTNTQYIEKATKELMTNLYLPFRLDVFLDVDNGHGMRSVLIERWLVHFDNRKKDAKAAKASVLNRQIGILMRTLYCFVRLLPSYQFSTQEPNCPLSYRVSVYDSSVNIDEKFPVKPAPYHFPPITTPHGYFTISLNYLDSAKIQSVYNPQRSDGIPIPGNNNNNNNTNGNGNGNNNHNHNQIIPQRTTSDVMKTPSRRHSTTSAPETIPVSARDMASTWTTYSGELRSPTQRSNDLTAPKLSSPLSENKLMNNRYQNLNGNSRGDSNDDEKFPMPPELHRNQSRSADSKPNYLINDHYFGTTNGLERDHERERERSSSIDRDRIHSRSRKPPQHPDTSSYSSHGSSPFINNTPAPFFIGGGSYTPSEGGNLLGVGEDIPSVTPPFQIPCALLSTSPSTGPGSSVAVLRDQLIGNNKLYVAEKNTIPEIISVQNLLPELPESPFETNLLPNNREPFRDSGQESHGENLDTDCMFDIDNCEDMPFAWQQTPTDSFLAHKIKEIESSQTKEPSFLNPKQSILAQQCLDPPALTGFESTALDGLKNSNDAFAKLNQMKQYHMATLVVKS